MSDYTLKHIITKRGHFKFSFTLEQKRVDVNINNFILASLRQSCLSVPFWTLSALAKIEIIDINRCVIDVNKQNLNNFANHKLQTISDNNTLAILALFLYFALGNQRQCFLINKDVIFSCAQDVSYDYDDDLDESDDDGDFVGGGAKLDLVVGIILKQ